jgi:hypothetical protein
MVKADNVIAISNSITVRNVPIPAHMTSIALKIIRAISFHFSLNMFFPFFPSMLFLLCLGHDYFQKIQMHFRITPYTRPFLRLYHLSGSIGETPAFCQARGVAGVSGGTSKLAPQDSVSGQRSAERTV